MAGAGKCYPRSDQTFKGRVYPLLGQSARALGNAKIGLAAAGATARDVVQWMVLFVEGVDLAAAYGAIGPELGIDEPAVDRSAGRSAGGSRR